jgi:hypothetical protein
MEKRQLDEGYFPAHAWHDNFFFINFPSFALQTNEALIRWQIS